jgi:hypothetical protein
LWAGLGAGTPIWVDADADVGDVLRAVEQDKIRRLPVIDNYRLVIMINEADLGPEPADKGSGPSQCGEGSDPTDLDGEVGLLGREGRTELRLWAFGPTATGFRASLKLACGASGRGCPMTAI